MLPNGSNHDMGTNRGMHSPRTDVVTPIASNATRRFTSLHNVDGGGAAAAGDYQDLPQSSSSQTDTRLSTMGSSTLSRTTMSTAHSTLNEMGGNLDLCPLCSLPLLQQHIARSPDTQNIKGVAMSRSEESSHTTFSRAFTLTMSGTGLSTVLEEESLHTMRKKPSRKKPLTGMGYVCGAMMNWQGALEEFVGNNCENMLCAEKQTRNPEVTKRHPNSRPTPPYCANCKLYIVQESTNDSGQVETLENLTSWLAASYSTEAAGKRPQKGAIQLVLDGEDRPYNNDESESLNSEEVSVPTNGKKNVSFMDGYALGQWDSVIHRSTTQGNNKTTNKPPLSNRSPSPVNTRASPQNQFSAMSPTRARSPLRRRYMDLLNGEERQVDESRQDRDEGRDSRRVTTIPVQLIGGETVTSDEQTPEEPSSSFSHDAGYMNPALFDNTSSLSSSQPPTTRDDSKEAISKVISTNDSNDDSDRYSAVVDNDHPQQTSPLQMKTTMAETMELLTADVATPKDDVLEFQIVEVDNELLYSPVVSEIHPVVADIHLPHDFSDSGKNNDVFRKPGSFAEKGNVEKEEKSPEKVKNIPELEQCSTKEEERLIIGDYMEKRNIATKAIGKKLTEGYILTQTQCSHCHMPMMDNSGTSICVVCPLVNKKAKKRANNKRRNYISQPSTSMSPSKSPDKQSSLSNMSTHHNDSMNEPRNLSKLLSSLSSPKLGGGKRISVESKSETPRVEKALMSTHVQNHQASNDEHHHTHQPQEIAHDEHHHTHQPQEIAHDEPDSPAHQISSPSRFSSQREGGSYHLGEEEQQETVAARSTSMNINPVQYNDGLQTKPADEGVLLRERKFDMTLASEEVYRRLLNGWLLTNQNCTLCAAPVMHSKEGLTRCILCYPLEEAGSREAITDTSGLVDGKFIDQEVTVQSTRSGDFTQDQNTTNQRRDPSIDFENAIDATLDLQLDQIADVIQNHGSAASTEPNQIMGDIQNSIILNQTVDDFRLEGVETLSTEHGHSVDRAWNQRIETVNTQSSPTKASFVSSFGSPEHPTGPDTYPSKGSTNYLESPRLSEEYKRWESLVSSFDEKVKQASSFSLGEKPRRQSDELESLRPGSDTELQHVDPHLFSYEANNSDNRLESISSPDFVVTANNVDSVLDSMMRDERASIEFRERHKNQWTYNDSPASAFRHLDSPMSVSSQFSASPLHLDSSVRHRGIDERINISRQSKSLPPSRGDDQVSSTHMNNVRRSTEKRVHSPVKRRNWSPPSTPSPNVDKKIQNILRFSEKTIDDHYVSSPSKSRGDRPLSQQDVNSNVVIDARVQNKEARQSDFIASSALEFRDSLVYNASNTFSKKKHELESGPGSTMALNFEIIDNEDDVKHTKSPKIPKKSPRVLRSQKTVMALNFDTEDDVKHTKSPKIPKKSPRVFSSEKTGDIVRSFRMQLRDVAYDPSSEVDSNASAIEFCRSCNEKLIEHLKTGKVTCHNPKCDNFMIPSGSIDVFNAAMHETDTISFADGRSIASLESDLSLLRLGSKDFGKRVRSRGKTVGGNRPAADLDLLASTSTLSNPSISPKNRESGHISKRQITSLIKQMERTAAEINDFERLDLHFD